MKKYILAALCMGVGFAFTGTKVEAVQLPHGQQLEQGIYAYKACCGKKHHRHHHYYKHHRCSYEASAMETSFWHYKSRLPEFEKGLKAAGIEYKETGESQVFPSGCPGCGKEKESSYEVKVMYKNTKEFAKAQDISKKILEKDGRAE